MPEQWMVRVEGKEYGPVDEDELREWREEGRLIPQNEVRRVNEDRWFPAGELPEDEPPAEAPDLIVRRRTWPQVYRETMRIYRGGFWRFLLFGLLTAVPMFILQWTLPNLPLPDLSSGTVTTMPPLTLPPISIVMLVALLLTWPISATGFQFVADDVLRGHKRPFSAQFSAALQSWGRMFGAGLFVYASYFFWFFAPLTAMIALIGGGGISALTLLLFLLVGAFMVYMNARLFINFLFWQQTTALGNESTMMAIRESKELARGGSDGPRLDRPLYRGALVASVWLLVALLLTMGVQLPFMFVRFIGIENPEQAMALAQTLSQAKPHDALSIASDVFTAALNLMLRPLLAAVFVVLYYDAKARFDPRRAGN